VFVRDVKGIRAFWKHSCCDGVIGHDEFRSAGTFAAALRDEPNHISLLPMVDGNLSPDTPALIEGGASSIGRVRSDYADSFQWRGARHLIAVTADTKAARGGLRVYGGLFLALFL
jgi:hypothetical protein